jgi:ABC-type transport system substrate-binding protein
VNGVEVYTILATGHAGGNGGLFGLFGKRVGLLLAALSFSGAGCGGFESESGGGENLSEVSEVLRDYLARNTSTLDPAQATDGSSFDDPNFENEEYDDLIASAKSEEDPGARMEMLRDAERLLLDGEAAIYPVHYAGSAPLVKPDVTYETHPVAPGVVYKLAGIE